MTVIGRVTSQGASQPLGARVLRVPPPLYYGAAFAAGMLLRAASVPLPLGARPETLVVAVVLLVSGTGLALAAVIGVVRNQTTIVPFPMPWHGAVGDLGRSLADQDHVRDLAPFRDRGPSRAPNRTAGPQMSVQVSAQMTTALDVPRLVDRLGTHPHLRPFGKRLGEVEADLLRAPLHTQLRLHHGRQFAVVELAGLGPATAQLGLLLGRVRRVLPDAGPSPRSRCGAAHD